MRIYSISPLYNYVELVFRTKKLFIIAVVIATAAAVAVVRLRPKFYSATSLIMLYDDAVNNSSDADSRGKSNSIQSKLTLLNVVLKDQKFFEQAFTRDGLDKDKNAVEFASFCREARLSISPSSRDNVLELNCRWPTNQCVQILNSFFDGYSRYVISHGSRAQGAVLTKLEQDLSMYKNKAMTAETALVTFQRESITTDGEISTPDQAPGDMQEAFREVKGQRDQVETFEVQIKSVKGQLASTSREITFNEEENIPSPTDTPEYKQLSTDKVTLTTKKNDLLQKYQDTHPDVLKVEEQLTKIAGQMSQIENDKTKKPGARKVRTQQNPTWLNLKNSLISLETQLITANTRLSNAQKKLAVARVQAPNAPKYMQQLNEYTGKYQIWRSMRDQVQLSYEQARLDFESEVERMKQGVVLLVVPQAELDTGGKKTLVFLLAGPLLGLVIAFAFSLLAETLDHSIRTPADVERFLNKPVLAVLPNMRPAKRVTELVKIALRGDWRSAPSAMPTPVALPAGKPTEEPKEGGRRLRRRT